MANPSPQPTSPQPKAGPAVGVKETTLATKTAFLQHTGSPLACHPDIFAAPCAHTYKIRKFYQAPNGRIDIVILGFCYEIDAFHIFLHSEKEIVSRLKKKKRATAIYNPFPPYWPSIFFHAFTKQASFPEIQKKILLYCNRGIKTKRTYIFLKHGQITIT